MNDSNEPRIRCRNVWKLFGPAPARFLREHGGTPDANALRAAGYIGAVRDVSLDVHRGEILVIMGLSGSGKSTLVRCLSRLIEADAGRILFDDIDLLQASAAQMIELRRHRMGMVFQHFALFPHRTVLQNVAFPLEVQGVPRSDREQRAARVVDLVGLTGREDYYPRELSGGQQQRVGIARSLVVEPEVWFLDEPFSALDPLIRREMQDEFLRLQSMLHKTIVFITHDFHEAIRLADRIAIMNEGALVQLGTAEELITRPASQYVREFTRDVPRDKLLSVRTAMDPLSGDRFADAVVAADDTIARAAPTVLASDLPVRVRDAEGRIVGTIRRERVIGILFDNAA